VRARTRPGDTIAVYMPFPKWLGGYQYFYARSLYTLAGRHVVALLDPDDRPHMERLGQAQWVCAYRSIPAFEHFTLAWRGRDGVLLRRVP
jgi:hypothetical protein